MHGRRSGRGGQRPAGLLAVDALVREAPIDGAVREVKEGRQRNLATDQPRFAALPVTVISYGRSALTVVFISVRLCAM